MENLPDQTVILERLLRIREYKQQVLNTIDKLKNNGDEIDRDLLSKLIKSYDSFKDQEEQYLQILQKILAVKQQYCSSLQSSASQSELSELSERTPLPSFSANLATENGSEQGEYANEALALTPVGNNLDYDIGFGDGVCSVNNSETNNLSASSLVTKSRELDELRKKLETLKRLCNVTDDDAVDEYENASGTCKSLENKLAVLKDSKKRVDTLLDLIESVDEETDIVAQTPSSVLNVESQNRYFSKSVNLPVNSFNVRDDSTVFAQSIGMPVSSNRTQILKSHPTSNSQRRSQNELETRPKMLIENELPVTASMQEKYNEIAATKDRLTKLQELMGHLQDGVESEKASSMSSRPPASNRVATRSNNVSSTEPEDDADSDVANMAVLSVRMRSAYESKLNEQQLAVQNLQAEHERLMSIKSQLMNLSGSQGRSQNVQLLHKPSDPVTYVEANRVCENNDYTRNNIQDSCFVERRLSASKPNVMQRMNNAESGVDHSNLPYQKLKNENSDAEYTKNILSNGIANNPRLPSFRRNNQLDDNPSDSGRRYTFGTPKADDVPMPSTPRRTSFESPAHQQQQRPGADYRRSDSRERCASVSLEEQYCQLQQHIDSIRSIFQQLMKDHGAQQQNSGNFSAPSQHYAPNLHNPAAAPSSMPNQIFQQLAQQQQQNAFEHLYASLLNPSSLAVQQQQLMVSLFSCQQQLQLQQMEMRHLQQLCQDLLNSRRVVENPDVYQQNRSRSASLVQQPAMQPQATLNLPPLDGRPLSTSSLYNLLAPNPYLPFPYYPGQMQQFNDHPQRSSHPGYRSSANRYQHGQKQCSSSYPLKQQQNMQMSQSLIEQGSDNESGYSNLKVMSTSDTAARLKTANDISDSNLGYSKLNASKKQIPFERQDILANPTGGQISYASNYQPDSEMSGDQFDVLREIIYSEVATLISQNEQRPHFLLELFRELQLLSSDHLRTRALQAVRNVLNNYLISESELGENEQEFKSAVECRSFADESQVDNSQLTTTFDDSSSKVVQRTTQLTTKENAQPDNLLPETPVEGKPSKNETSSHSAESEISDRVSTNAQTKSIRALTNNSSVDVVGLEQQIQNVVDELIPYLKENVESSCNHQLLQYMRKLVISLAIKKCLPSGSATTFFQRQLSSILDDTLAKFQGQKLQDCGEELLGDVSEVLFNELAFFRLMQNIDSVDNERRKSDADESEDNLGPETTEPEDGSESDRSSGQASSPEPRDIAASAHNDVSEISEEIDVSAITAISTSREAVRVDNIKTITEKTDNSCAVKLETDVEKSKFQHPVELSKPVEVVLTTPLKVQVTAATDEDENSLSTSESMSMHTAGNQVDKNDLVHQNSADSRETSPPDELLMDAEDIPENIDSIQDQATTLGQDREITTFDLDFEPHPEDKLQLTIDSVEFRNLQNQLVVPDEVEEEDDEGQEAVNENGKDFVSHEKSDNVVVS